MKKLLDKQKSLESAISDLEVSLSSASEKVTSLDRSKKKLDIEVKRRLSFKLVFMIVLINRVAVDMTCLIS